MSYALTELVDRIRSKLPGYDGYLNVEKRKKTSELIRSKICRELGEASTNLNRSLETAFDQFDRDACAQLEKTRAEIETLKEKIKSAEAGYRPRDSTADKEVFVRPSDIKRGKKAKSLTRDMTVVSFDKVVHFDEMMLRDCEDIKTLSDQLALGSFDNDKLRSFAATILAKVLDIDETFQKRMDMLKGVSDVIH